MKRIIILFVVFALTGIIFFSCGQAANKGNNEPDGTTAVDDMENDLLGNWLVTIDTYATPGLEGLYLTFNNDGTCNISNGESFSYTLRRDTQKYIKFTGIVELEGEVPYIITTDLAGTWFKLGGSFVMKKQ
jgi:hypothetical protein